MAADGFSPEDAVRCDTADTVKHEEILAAASLINTVAAAACTAASLRRRPGKVPTQTSSHLSLFAHGLTHKPLTLTKP